MSRRNVVRARPAAPVRGLKQHLPSKPCAVCGRPMGWRKRWARTWDEVRYCSDACRRRKAEAPVAPGDGD